MGWIDRDIHSTLFVQTEERCFIKLEPGYYDLCFVYCLKNFEFILGLKFKNLITFSEA
jgi:hypothetical protein